MKAEYVKLYHRDTRYNEKLHRTRNLVSSRKEKWVRKREKLRLKSFI